uniref:Transcription factor CBF/NF-Y/archaeal histone domain-containing protein n=1 Tax=Florenciella sp. virus SA2 TaxID=3240092 RepID=A0AB39J7T1_9VIRU
MNNIPLNIKSGVGNNDDLNVLEKKELEINVTSCIMTFMSFAMKSSAIYVEHSNRTVITTDDIKKAMMVEVFTYFDRTDLEERVSEWRQTIIEDMKNQESDEESDEESEVVCKDYDISGEKIINNCQCNICNTMNTIKEKWNYYNPTDELGLIFKKHIDKI